MCKGPEAEQGRAGLGGAGGKGEAPGGGGGLGAGAVGEHGSPKSGRVHPAWCLLAQGRTASPSPEDNVKSHWPLIQKLKKKKKITGGRIMPFPLHPAVALLGVHPGDTEVSVRTETCA